MEFPLENVVLFPHHLPLLSFFFFFFISIFRYVCSSENIGKNLPYDNHISIELHPYSHPITDGFYICFH
jgi:hypothetical protein